MFVVFDSNIWLSELGLRSGAGAATRFFLNHHGARLAIPEVVRLEVRHHLQNTLTEHIETIRDSYRQLLTAFGKLREIVLPTDAEVQSKVEELFALVEVENVDVPFALESARSSFLKILDRLPPSDKAEQFKDGVLWADCLSLLLSDSVVLVTSDKAFYQDRLYANGLARNLQTEADDLPHRLQILPTLSALLKTLRTTVTLKEDSLAESFLAESRQSVYGILARNGFDLGLRESLTYSLFATENPHVLFMEFSMRYRCSDARGEGRTDAVVTVKGDGSFRPATGRFTDLRNFGEHLSYRTAEGEEEKRNVVALFGNIVLGHREISHVTRYKLEEL